MHFKTATSLSKVPADLAQPFKVRPCPPHSPPSLALSLNSLQRRRDCSWEAGASGPGWDAGTQANSQALPHASPAQAPQGPEVEGGAGQTQSKQPALFDFEAVRPLGLNWVAPPESLSYLNHLVPPILLLSAPRPRLCGVAPGLKWAGRKVEARLSGSRPARGCCLGGPGLEGG